MRPYGIEQHPARRQPDRGPARDRRLGRGRPRSAPPRSARITADFPSPLLIIRADLEVGRGDFDAARAHLEAARATLREDRALGLYDAYVAELALWERRWTDADEAVRDGLARARPREAAQIRV